MTQYSLYGSYSYVDENLPFLSSIPPTLKMAAGSNSELHSRLYGVSRYKHNLHELINYFGIN